MSDEGYEIRLPKLSKSQWLKTYVIGSSIAILALIGGMIYMGVYLHQMNTTLNATQDAVGRSASQESVDSLTQDVQNTDSDVQNVCSSIPGC